MMKAPSDSTVAATAFVSGLRPWYGLGTDGASAARKATSSAPSGSTPRVAGWMGSGLREAHGLLALREPRDEPPAQRAEDREDDEEGQRLVDRIGQQALLEDRRTEIVAR